MLVSLMVCDCASSLLEHVGTRNVPAMCLVCSLGYGKSSGKKSWFRVVVAKINMV